MSVDDPLSNSEPNAPSVDQPHTSVACDIVTAVLSLLIVVEAQRQGVDLQPAAEVLSTVLQFLQNLQVQ